MRSILITIDFQIAAVLVRVLQRNRTNRMDVLMEGGRKERKRETERETERN